VALLLCLAGCEWVFPIDAPRGVGDVDAATDGAPPDPDVHGRQQEHHVGARAIDVAPSDLSRVAVAAMVPDPISATGFRVIPGRGDAAGGFTIPDVPSGEYYLRWQPDGVGAPTYFVTAARDLDFSLPLMRPAGRSDVVAQTGVTFTLSAVQGWAPADRLVAYATGGWAAAPVATSAPGFPAAGATSLALTVDWRGAQGWYGSFPPVLDQAAGDQLALLRYGARQTSTGLSYEAVKESFLAPSSMISGTPIALTGPFADSTPNLQFALSTSGAAFAARAEEALPEGEPLSQVDWQVVAVPGANQGAATGLPLASGTIDRDTANNSDRGVVAYSDPFGNIWPHVLAGTYYAGLLYRLPGTQLDVPRLAQILVLTPIAQGSASLAPVVALPTFPTLAGVSLRTDDQVVVLDAAAPVPLTWTITEGRADHFAIAVSRIDGRGERVPAAWLRTGDRHVVIPAGTFVAGERYVIELTAVTGWPRANDGDWFTTDWPRGKASVDSVVFRIADSAGG